MSFPAFYTPITKYTAHFNGTQSGPCGAEYMDYMRCASRVGLARAAYVCHKEVSDFHECVHMTKQLKRVIAMEKERKRQKRPYIEPLGKDILGKEY